MLSQHEANVLLRLEKKNRNEEVRYEYPDHREKLTLELMPVEERHKEKVFHLDINRGYMALRSRTLQHRAKQTVILRRLDFYGSHFNPPIETMPNGIDSTLQQLMEKYEMKHFRKETHLHVYIEEYNERWAFPISEFGIDEHIELDKQIDAFCKHCNILTSISQSRSLLWQP